MKLTWCSMLLVAGAVTGCVPLPRNPKEAELPPAPQLARPRSAIRPVTPDQVTETNAAQKAEELRQELDREAEILAQPPQHN